MFAKILIPVDGSNAAWKALDYAIELGKKFESTLIPVHVVEPVVLLPVADSFPYIPPELLTDMQNLGEKLLKTAGERLVNYPHSYQTKLAYGNPPSKILDIAEEEQCDAIAMGSKGLTGIKEFLLGSVSTNVVHHAKIPVLIIK